jgi:SAM-dependent methyltransferase
MGDYITELTYLHGYFPELSPVRMKLALLKAGLHAPEVTNACELGFGYGDSIVVNAATSSAAWYGIDLNPEHVAWARNLARSSGASIRLYEDSIVDFANRDDLPEFDFIVLHGVWSWVSPESRRAVVDFVRKRLRVGGVFYISYNTQPGWAPLTPLRELLTEHAERAGKNGTPLRDRVDAAIAFADRLLESDPAYAADNPGVAVRLAQIRKQNRNYVAHEYFNRHFSPMHFSEVASLLAAADLTYAGPANVGNVDAVTLTRSQRALLESIEDSTFREFVRDLLVDRSLRRDYWVKGPIAPLPHGDRSKLLRGTPFVALTPNPALHPRLRAALALNGGPGPEAYRRIVETIERHALTSLEAIEAALHPLEASLDQILDVVLLLGREEQLAPAQADNDIVAVRGQTQALNAQLLSRLRSGNGLDYLASPVTGTGVRVPVLHQSFLLALHLGESRPEAWVKLAGTIPPPQPGNEPPGSADRPGDPTQLLERARRFAEDELPVFRRLAIA